MLDQTAFGECNTLMCSSSNTLAMCIKRAYKYHPGILTFVHLRFNLSTSGAPKSGGAGGGSSNKLGDVCSKGWIGGGSLTKLGDVSGCCSGGIRSKRRWLFVHKLDN